MLRLTQNLAIVTLLVALVGVALAEPARANGILLTGSGGREPSRQASAVTLDRHTVQVKITDQVAEVTVEQIFRSRARGQLEGTYVFPLPDGAVVSDFAMTMAGKMVKGEVIEAKRARAIYEGIVRRRRDPGLLEYVGRGLFRARVFPIEPGKDLTIRLSFQQVLTDDHGTLEFRYPLATDRMNGQPVASATVTVDIESRVPLKALYSTSHRVEITRDGEHRAKASFERQGVRQTEDFVLFLGRSPQAVGFSLLSHKEPAKDGTFMAVIAPQSTVRAEEQVPRDVVFVLDTSGSMEGGKIEQARKALAFGVRILGPKDRFNIVAFSTSTRSFRDGLVPASAEVRAAAQTWIQGLTAGGGTDLHSALLTGVQLARPDRSCMVVLLTDGKPSVGLTDADQILSSVGRANAHKARIFTFGVGHDLDVGFLDRVAKESRGARDYVAPGEDIEIVTSRFFRKVSRPVLANVTLELGAGIRDVYPRQIGDLFAGTQVVIFGRYREAGDRTITLTGTLADATVRIEHAAHFRDKPGPEYLERLWANRKVAFLLDEIRLNGRNKELVEEVIALATQHAIITPYTSGLVVEDGVATDNDLPFAESFGGRDTPFEGPATNGTIGIGGGAGGAFRGRGGARDLGTGGGGRKFDDTADDGLRWLAAHQRPDGSWSAHGYDAFCDGKTAQAWDDDAHRGRPDRDIHVTAQATLAFLAAGYTNWGKHPFARVVSRALRFLKNVQDPEGCFGPRRPTAYLSGHAQATQAMVEAFGMTGSPIFRGAAQRGLDFLAITRQPHAVWGRGVKSTEADLRVTTWAASAFLAASLINQSAARRGRASPLIYDAAARDDLVAWIGRVTDPKRGGALASALPSAPQGTPNAEAAAQTRAAMIGWLRVLTGEDARTSKAIARCAEILSAGPKKLARAGEQSYFGGMLLFQVGRAPWNQWRKGMHGAAGSIELQERSTTLCERRGSWQPRGARSRENGRVGATALRAMEMVVVYRYDAGVSIKEVRSVPATASRRAPAKPLSATDASKALKEQKAAATSAEIRTTGRTKRVAGTTLVQEVTGRWVDTSWDRTAKPTRVEALSKEYFELVRAHPSAARLLALGNRLVVVIAGTPYEIVPPK